MADLQKQKQEAERIARQRVEDEKKRLALDGRDLDRDGDVDLADSVINDLDRDGRIDADDREQFDIDNDNDIDATDRQLRNKKSVGQELGMTKTDQGWQHEQSQQQQQSVPSPKVG